MGSLFNGRHGIKHITLVNTFSLIRVYREVAYAERCEVLKEMRALAGVHAIVLKTLLNDNPRRGDMRPFHRDA